MTIFESIILGLVQGLTEFLPVSSSGHLVIVPKILHLSPQPLYFDTTLHLGTLAALILYFWADLNLIVRALLLDAKSIWQVKKFELDKLSPDSLFGLKVALGSVPAVFLGIFFGDFLEEKFRNVGSVILFLSLGSILLFVSEFFYAKLKKSENVSWFKSFLIGVFQALALLPGISRSGSTISGGILLGFDRETAARFSFLLSIPVIAGAGLFGLIKMFSDLSSVSLISVFIGFLASFISGFLAIKFLLSFLRSNKLYAFVIYRVILAFLLVILML